MTISFATARRSNLSPLRPHSVLWRGCQSANGRPSRQFDGTSSIKEIASPSPLPVSTGSGRCRASNRGRAQYATSLFSGDQRCTAFSAADGFTLAVPVKIVARPRVYRTSSASYTLLPMAFAPHMLTDTAHRACLVTTCLVPLYRYSHMFRCRRVDCITDEAAQPELRHCQPSKPTMEDRDQAHYRMLLSNVKPDEKRCASCWRRHKSTVFCRLLAQHSERNWDESGEFGREFELGDCPDDGPDGDTNQIKSPTREIKRRRRTRSQIDVSALSKLPDHLAKRCMEWYGEGPSLSLPPSLHLSLSLTISLAVSYNLHLLSMFTFFSSSTSSQYEEP
jgi:hypothetical protein